MDTVNVNRTEFACKTLDQVAPDSVMRAVEINEFGLIFDANTLAGLLRWAANNPGKAQIAANDMLK